MGSSKTIPENGSVYLDELTLSATWRLLQIRGLSEITVLEAIKTGQKLWGWLLKKKGVHVAEATFFTGHLKTGDGESVRRVSRRVADKIAFQSSEEIVRSEPQLLGLNKAYGRNTIRLFIAKQLYQHIEYWTLRALVARTLCTSGRAEVWMKKASRFDGSLIVEALPDIDIRFYSTAEIGVIELVKSWIFDTARNIKLTHGAGKSSGLSEPVRNDKPSVMALQEDNIRADRSLRGQPHWLDVNNPSNIFNTFLIELQGSKFRIADDLRQFSKAGVTILPASVFGTAVKLFKKNKTLARVRRDRSAVFKAVIHARGFANKFFLLRIAFLLRQAELVGALALWLNTRVFLVRETYYYLADAMQLVAPDINVTTIAYQYSNMGFISPIMMSTADKFLIFSDMYKASYRTDEIMPNEFLPTGYLYDDVSNYVSERAGKHREALFRAGAEFIVCYFDESVQDDRWGLMNTSDHLGEIHALVKTVLSDPTFGVVVKTQFISNSPCLLYPDDELIQAAKKTGRYLELMEGVHRNDIYPTEAALVADICIGHKFGATAALEAAIAGVRTILLDTYGIKTLLDDVYVKADIEYESMDSLLAAIARHRAGNPAERAIGDWTPILHYFDPYRDGKAVHRLRREIMVSI